MTEATEVVAIAEGQTEEIFVRRILSPYLIRRCGISMRPVLVGGPGQGGGDVRFARVREDIIRTLGASDAFVTLLVDYYGIGTDWPGYDESKAAETHRERSRILLLRTGEWVATHGGNGGAPPRFIPYVSMFELEALWFTAPGVVASRLGIEVGRVEAILEECGEPERINDSPIGAPSKRLRRLAGNFRKSRIGIEIAEEIGVDAMRTACPLFGEWVTTLERLGAAGR